MEEERRVPVGISFAVRAWLDVRLTKRKEWTKGYSALAATSLANAMVNESPELESKIGTFLSRFLSVVTESNELYLKDGEI